jgi:DNA-binding transcriptional ArsR family regulator
MFETPYVAEMAALIGDPARANMLCCLREDGELSAAELASVAGIARSTASGHLARLVDAGVIEVEPVGRHRYYRLANDAVAYTLEALEALAEACAVRHRLPAPNDEAVRFARVCYDHLAGRVSVAIARAMVAQGHLQVVDRDFRLNRPLVEISHLLGINFAAVSSSGRKTVRGCLDWSEGELHLGGVLGAGLYSHFCKRNWVRTEKGSSAVRLTPVGKKALREHFQVEL